MGDCHTQAQARKRDLAQRALEALFHLACLVLTTLLVVLVVRVAKAATMSLLSLAFWTLLQLFILDCILHDVSITQLGLLQV